MNWPGMLPLRRQDDEKLAPVKPYSILHISDLHRSRSDPISNDELISALINDRDHYVCEDPPIAPPEAIIVSGDIIQGVPLGTVDFAKTIAEQYAVAEAFLDELVRRFLNGDRSRLVMVPGNHDIDWNTAFAALEPVPDDEVPQRLESALFADDSNLRWDWKTRTLFRVTDSALYERRLEAFWEFFRGFYHGVPSALKMAGDSNVNLYTLCDQRIGVAAYNSCHGNDCFAFHGRIRKETVARSHLDLKDSEIPFDLLLAVWHHNIDGPPNRSDYMDADIVRGMIGRGFRIGLYGHQHKAQATPREIWLPDRERMAVISAGSLCAGAQELPTGVHRQYNILEIADDFEHVRVHVRAMNVANLFSRGQLMEFGGKSFADLDWELPRSIVGSVVHPERIRTRAAIQQAEHEAKMGSPAAAVAILRELQLRPSSYERELFISAAFDAEDWPAIVEITDSPRTIDELIRRIEAFLRLGTPRNAIECLDQFAEDLELPKSLEEDLRGRAKAQEAMKR